MAFVAATLAHFGLLVHGKPVKRTPPPPLMDTGDRDGHAWAGSIESQRRWPSDGQELDLDRMPF